ncbi:hypothetical protein ACLKA7_004102 [Drosophila subpalustris]
MLDLARLGQCCLGHFAKAVIRILLLSLHVVLLVLLVVVPEVVLAVVLPVLPVVLAVVPVDLAAAAVVLLHVAAGKITLSPSVKFAATICG